MKPRQYAIGIDLSSEDFAVSISTDPGIALYGPKMFDNTTEGFKELNAWINQTKGRGHLYGGNRCLRRTPVLLP